MNIAFIHNDKKLGTGAHFINELMATRLRESGVRVKNFYPRNPLLDAPLHLKGISNILFFYSLLEHKDDILKYDLIQGTTYTPLAFLPFSIPVVSHFGSTSWGFLKAVPISKEMDPALRKIWFTLKKDGAIRELHVRTRRPLKDIAEIEKLVACRADTVIATSQIVRKDLLDVGVMPKRIRVVPNAIEDYWFHKPFLVPTTEKPCLIFLGRLGVDAFTLKLKGLDRVVDYYQAFPDVQKYTIAITTNKDLVRWCNGNILQHHFFANLKKEKIPDFLNGRAGGILLVTSRYEGFSLSLVEGMSQGLIPVSYPVGIAPEIIKNGKNGFLVHSQSEGKKAIKYLLTISEEKRSRMVRAVQQTAQEFNSKLISRRLIEVYADTLKKQSRQYGAFK